MKLEKVLEKGIAVHRDKQTGRVKFYAVRRPGHYHAISIDGVTEVTLNNDVITIKGENGEKQYPRSRFGEFNPYPVTEAVQEYLGAGHSNEEENEEPVQ